MTSNRELVDRALGLLLQGLYPYVEQEMSAVYGDRWMEKATPNRPKDPCLKRPIAEILQQDVSMLLKVMKYKWQPVFLKNLGQAERGLISELLDTRNKLAHDFTFPSDQEDTYRALDSVERLLRAIGDIGKAEIVKKEKQKIISSERKLRIVTIPSVRASENKTTSVVNIAYELAEKGKKVLVFDYRGYSATTSLLLGVNKANEDANNYIYPSSFNTYLNNKGSLDIIERRAMVTDNFNLEDFIYKSVFGQYDFFIIIGFSYSSWRNCTPYTYFLIPFPRKLLSLLKRFNRTIIRQSRLIQEDIHPSHGNILWLVPINEINNIFVLFLFIFFFDFEFFKDVEIFNHMKVALSYGQPVSVYFHNNNKVSSDVRNRFPEISEKLIQKIEFIENNKNK